MYTSYSNVPMNYNQNRPPMMGNNNDRLFVGGGFLGPFLLGGITGAALRPGFGYGRPYYNNNYYYYPPYPYPYYGPYYR